MQCSALEILGLSDHVDVTLTCTIHLNIVTKHVPAQNPSHTRIQAEIKQVLPWSSNFFTLTSFPDPVTLHFCLLLTHWLSFAHDLDTRWAKKKKDMISVSFLLNRGSGERTDTEWKEGKTYENTTADSWAFVLLPGQDGGTRRSQTWTVTVMM